jgi:hypothetical protein
MVTGGKGAGAQLGDEEGKREGIREDERKWEKLYNTSSGAAQIPTHIMVAKMS